MQMTKAEALKIQAMQIEHYAQQRGEYVRQLVANATNADTLPEGLHEVYIVNRHIPRGGAIEYLIDSYNTIRDAIPLLGLSECDPDDSDIMQEVRDRMSSLYRHGFTAARTLELTAAKEATC